jgi:flagellar motility protein MotE (MotC chaperone)
MEEGNFYKEKMELLKVRDELNEFYEEKELEYIKKKAKLSIEYSKVKAELEKYQKIKEKNEEILAQIKREKVSKPIKLYGKMKLKVAVNIFNQMIKEGKFDEVFDILTRLKVKRVMKILKKFDTRTSTLMMEKMRIIK